MSRFIFDDVLVETDIIVPHSWVVVWIGQIRKEFEKSFRVLYTGGVGHDTSSGDVTPSLFPGTSRSACR